MERANYPLLLTPHLAERIWGGSLMGEGIGEAWDLSVHPHGPARIANGPLAGTTLADAASARPAEFGGPIELLAKRLDCAQDLSVQVHPKQGDPKTESWVVLHAEPGAALYAAAKPLMNPVKFSNKIDFTWFELWHHEGRRARHGASMMGPDYTHWHGTYDLAKHFYVKYIPELEELIEKGEKSGDAEKQAAAKTLKELLDEILNNDDHKWYLGKMSDEEKAERAKRAAEFKARYK